MNDSPSWYDAIQHRVDFLGHPYDAPRNPAYAGISPLLRPRVVRDPAALTAMLDRCLGEIQRREAAE